MTTPLETSVQHQSEEKPDQDEQKLYQAEQKPHTAEQKPHQAEQNPQQAEQKPHQAGQKPQNAEQTPQQAEQKQQHAEQKPQHAEQKPQHAEQTPHQAGQKPHQAEQNPHQAEPAVQKTVQTENVSSRDQRPQPIDWAAVIGMTYRIKVGERVRRGPGWCSGNNEDGGGPGTVVHDGGRDALSRYVWEVSWDCGTRGTYYMGPDTSGRVWFNLEIV